MKKRIVVADDFENTRWVIEFTLRKIDCEILKAKDGEEALRYFDGQHIDLLISDYNMPKLNGHELVNKVREIEIYRKLPILILTTETDENKKREIEELKITAWIKKPFEADRFLKIVEKCLK